jgi:hypothetical protein
MGLKVADWPGYLRFRHERPDSCLCRAMVACRLSKSLIGLPHGEKRTIVIPAGSILEMHESAHSVGVMTVVCEGKPIRVFAGDLKESVPPVGEIG